MFVYIHVWGVCVQYVHIYTVYSTEVPGLVLGLGICFIDWAGIQL